MEQPDLKTQSQTDRECEDLLKQLEKLPFQSWPEGIQKIARVAAAQESAGVLCKFHHFNNLNHS